jgi:hypothetical protein
MILLKVEFESGIGKPAGAESGSPPLGRRPRHERKNIDSRLRKISSGLPRKQAGKAVNSYRRLARWEYIKTPPAN